MKTLMLMDLSITQSQSEAVVLKAQFTRMYNIIFSIYIETAEATATDSKPQTEEAPGEWCFDTLSHHS